MSCWFYLQLDPRLLAPVFFADPAGAVVGKTLTRYLPALNPTWYQKKTVRFRATRATNATVCVRSERAPTSAMTRPRRAQVCGSAAVFALTYLTTFYPCGVAHRAGVASLAALAEAVGGDYDNLALAAVVVLGWRGSLGA